MRLLRECPACVPNSCYTELTLRGKLFSTCSLRSQWKALQVSVGQERRPRDAGGSSPARCAPEREAEGAGTVSGRYDPWNAVKEKTEQSTHMYANTYTCSQACTCTRVYTYICTYVYMHSLAHVYTYTHLCTRTCTSTHTRAHTYTHHTRTYTHILPCPRQLAGPASSFPEGASSLWWKHRLFRGCLI